MTDDAMRAALEAAKEVMTATPADCRLFGPVLQQIDEALKSGPAAMSDTDIEAAKEAAFRAGYEQREKEILETPRTGVPADTLEAFEQTKQALEDLRSFVAMQGGGHVRNQLLNLPDQIKEQQLLMTKRTAEIEEQRLELEKIRNGHKEFVLNAKEGDKPKFGNDRARDLAVAMLLQDDKVYNDLLDSTRNKERLQRLSEIDLTHLNNLFGAYLALAGMRG